MVSMPEMATPWHENDGSRWACWFQGRQLDFSLTWDYLFEILIWDFWPNPLMNYSIVYLVWLKSGHHRDFERGLGTATYVNVGCLRLSLTRASVYGNMRSLFYLRLSRGINSCTVSYWYFNIIDLTTRWGWRNSCYKTLETRAWVHMCKDS